MPKGFLEQFLTEVSGVCESKRTGRKGSTKGTPTLKFGSELHMIFSEYSRMNQSSYLGGSPLYILTLLSLESMGLHILITN